MEQRPSECGVGVFSAIARGKFLNWFFRKNRFEGDWGEWERECGERCGRLGKVTKRSERANETFLCILCMSLFVKPSVSICGTVTANCKEIISKNWIEMLNLAFSGFTSKFNLTFQA